MPLPQHLYRVGKKFRIPRLLVACDRLIKIHETANKTFSTILEDEDDDEEEEEEDEEDDEDDGGAGTSSSRIRVDSSRRNFIHSVFSKLNLDLPPSTLSRDLGSLVGDSQYADIRFIAEGRSLSAHRYGMVCPCHVYVCLRMSVTVTGFRFRFRFVLMCVYGRYDRFRYDMI